MGMDGETPSWLEEGESAAQPPPVAPPPLNPEKNSDAAAPPAPATAPVAARDGLATDNVAGSFLASMGAKKKPDVSPAAATATVEDDKELPKLILFMRVLNMAAATLLITVSVSRSIVPTPRVPATCHTRIINYTMYDIIVSCLLNYHLPTLSFSDSLHSTDNPTDRHPSHFHLGDGHLRIVRGDPRLLPRDAAQIRPHLDRHQLRIPLPFRLSHAVLLSHGERVLVVQQHPRVCHGHRARVRGGFQHVRALSVSIVQEDERGHRRGGGQEDPGEDQPTGS